MDSTSLMVLLLYGMFQIRSVAGVEDEDGISKVPWITVNSNRFCCDIKQKESSSKYTHDNENVDILNALEEKKKKKLDIYNYRTPNCQAKTSCVTHPPVLFYTGYCRQPSTATTDLPKGDDETERCRVYKDAKPNVEEILPERRRKSSYADTDCEFRVDFTLTVDLDKGFKVFTTYATEKTQQTVKDDLAEPKTKNYFSETTIGDTKDIFGFPYFLVIRVFCDDEGFYGDGAYRFPLNGNTLSTSIALMYRAYTSRQPFQASLKLSFEAVFVELEQDKENSNNLVPDPDTPRVKDPDTKEDLCPLNVCFPGFLIPFPFLKVAVSTLVIREHRGIRALQKMIYDNPFHKREAAGNPPLEIAEVFSRYNLETDLKEKKFVDSTLISPRYFFPSNRYGEYDKDLEGFDFEPSAVDKLCVIPERYQLQGEYGISPFFFLEGNEEKLIYAMDEMDVIKSHLPLTQDDFLMPQYTLGTSPVVVLAGFFRPDLLMFGNPEMERIELIKWAYNEEYDKSADQKKPSYKRIFFPNPVVERPKEDVIPDCVSTDFKLIEIPPSPDPSKPPSPPPDRTLVSPTLQKPMYADVEESCYGRRQYYPMDYTSPNTHAIFEVISMEDRLLLRTAGGLVSLYGFGDIASRHDIVLHAKQNETLYRCFKFVRVVKKALMPFDPILAVTYSYTERSTGKIRDQEVHYGTFTKPGEPIKWVEVGSSEFEDSKDRSPHHISPAIANTGTTEDIPEAWKICNIVFRERILSAFDDDLKDSTASFDAKNKKEYKCLILDGSPVPTRPNSIQLLVEMSFKFYKNKICKENPASDPIKCTPLVPATCMRHKYCIKLFKDLEKELAKPPPTPPPPPPPVPGTGPTTEKPPVPRNKNFLDLVKKPDCLKNPEALLKGYYDGDTKDYEKAKATPLNDYLKTSSTDAAECTNAKFDLTPAAIPLSDSCNFEVQKITLYIIAEHEMGKIVHRGNTWDIVAVYPRRYCIVPHYEAIRIVLGFDGSYFGKTNLHTGLRIRSGTGDMKTCYEKSQDAMENDLYITRFTYSRQINLNAFFYGNALLHSVDGGKSLSHLRHFPKHSMEAGLDYDLIQLNNRHVIKLMAFSDDGQFAFLTSKRELWLGNSGSDKQLRLRPSDGYSMMHLELYKNRPGIAQAVPFSLLFDSFGNLFELAVVRDSEGHAQEILKRPINRELILRNEFFVEALHGAVNKEMVKHKEDVVRVKKAPTLPVIKNQLVEFEEDGIDFAVVLDGPGASCDSSLGCLPVHYEIDKLTLHCPFSQMKVQQNYTKTSKRLQELVFLGPIQHPKLGLDYKFGALKAYQAAAFALVHDSFFVKEGRAEDFYSHVPRDPFVKWKTEKLDETHVGLLNYLRGDPKKTGVLVDPRLNTRNTDPNDASKFRFMDSYWMDYNQTVELILQFHIKNAQLLSKTDFQRQRLSEIQLNIDNGNGKIIQLETERVTVAKYASVKFVIYIKLIKNTTLLKQNEPGQGLLPVPLTFHLIGAFGRCFNLRHWGMIGESITTTVFAGCPPASDILFNWNATLHSLMFKDPQEKYGDATYCHKREFVCFFAREAITFHFDVLDVAKQRYTPFTGIYKFKVVGGGRTKSEIEDYTPEEIEAYNIPGKSDVSLIWNLALVQEDEIHVAQFEDLGKDPLTQEVLLRSGASRIKWVCNTLSPCSRIAPRGILFKTIYYFKVEITNDGVDEGTLCKHKLTFMIMLYGFPPSPEILLLTTLIFCIMLLILMYIMFVCCRRNKKVWRANKLKFSGWMKIVIDTFPRPMRKKANAVDEQTRKDAILLSLQGHLKVPDVIQRKREGSPVSEEDISVHSSPSSASTQHPSDILPDVKARRAAATWTDMVYEQIISRRLLSIVERNKRMREEIMKKALESNILDEIPGSSVAASKTAVAAVNQKEGLEKKGTETKNKDKDKDDKPKDKDKDKRK